MPVERFPNPRLADDEEGIVAFGGDLDPDSLRLAYGQGIFPWPIEDLPLPWFCPPQRGILEFDALHIPKSLQKVIKRAEFRTTLDKHFDAVIQGCATQHAPTWITPEMMAAYCQLHREGGAHSIEVWKDDRLVGGIYGVDCGGAFACESMFHLEDNASKIAVLAMIDHLKSRGLDWIDIQMVTPHMERLGAREITRDEFLDRLAATRERNLTLFSANRPS